MELTPSQIAGANVRAEMARRGISQKQLAEVLGLSQTSISKRLRGETPFDVNELSAISSEFDIPAATFFGVAA